MPYDIAVIGAGASGLMAGGAAAHAGARVTLFERNGRLGKKIVITGKGRCNLTNDCGVDEFLQNIPTNPRFLYSALSRFTPRDTIAFFEELGAPLKTERGGRVFPASDSSFDIVDALRRYIERGGARVEYAGVSSLDVRDGAVRGLTDDRGQRRPFDRVIVCTGGLSYPSTGATGDGYAFAAAAGHNLVPTRPSLVPVEVNEEWCAGLAGLALKNVEASLKSEGKTLFHERGELLFTHFGLSGPLILSMSAQMRPESASGSKINIDLKPALDSETLDRRMLADLTKYANRGLSNALCDLLPQRLIPVVINLSGADPSQKANSVTREQRQHLGSILKSLPLTVKSLRAIEEAVVTGGGVDVRQVDPRTMESRIVSGLYFAGEVLDVDGLTGGFNLQIAFSTGRAAGLAAGAAANG